MRRGTVKRAAPGGLFAIEREDGGYVLLEQLNGEDLKVGDFISGIPRVRGTWDVRNETARRTITVFIASFDATSQEVMLRLHVS